MTGNDGCPLFFLLGDFEFEITFEKMGIMRYECVAIDLSKTTDPKFTSRICFIGAAASYFLPHKIFICLQ